MLSKTIPNVETPFTHFLTLQETLFDLANMLISEGFLILSSASSPVPAWFISPECRKILLMITCFSEDRFKTTRLRNQRSPTASSGGGGPPTGGPFSQALKKKKENNCGILKKNKKAWREQVKDLKSSQGSFIYIAPKVCLSGFYDLSLETRKTPTTNSWSEEKTKMEKTSRTPLRRDPLPRRTDMQPMSRRHTTNQQNQRVNR